VTHKIRFPLYANFSGIAIQISHIMLYAGTKIRLTTSSA